MLRYKQSSDSTGGGLLKMDCVNCELASGSKRVSRWFERLETFYDNTYSGIAGYRLASTQ
jgi:hypothetical protein